MHLEARTPQIDASRGASPFRNTAFSAATQRSLRALRWALLIFCSGSLFASPEAGNGDHPHAAPPAEWFQRLHLLDLNGAPLNPSARWFVVFFMSQDCPVSNVYIPVMNALAAAFASKGFAFVGAYVDPTADLATLRKHAADFGIAFVTADDREHRLVRAGGATYTPEAEVFSAAGSLVYKGRIDDRVGNLGATKPTATHHDLGEALAGIASGSPGPFKGIPGYGCAIPEDVHP